MFRSRIWLAAVLGSSLAASRPTLAGPPAVAEPARLPLTATPALTNQQMADTIARHLQQSGRLHRYSIDVAFSSGLAELSGTVADQSQREEALRLVQGVPGVERVRDHLVVDGAVNPVHAEDPPRLPPPLPGGVPRAAGERPPEPAPIFQGPPMSPFDLNPPKMPSYAWPTYAPYNNYSRVAYPQCYPYQSWPFIGPFYPYPKIPPGWRCVKLEWDDGHWWFSTHATKYDWWRLRFW